MIYSFLNKSSNIPFTFLSASFPLILFCFPYIVPVADEIYVRTIIGDIQLVETRNRSPGADIFQMYPKIFFSPTNQMLYLCSRHGSVFEYPDISAG
jgi:hypothetical protein